MLVETASTTVSTVAGAIRNAARLTGTGFDYLLATAQIESRLNPTVKAPTSSATGLFQFVDQTWLETLKQAGPRLGYSSYADAIARNASGRYVVRDPQLRSEIMNLRKDPIANALMGAAFTQRNAARLADKLGRTATEGELYMAHFLGAGGAARLIATAENQPDRRAADLLPHAAAANRAIFYGRNGRALTVAQVYGKLASKLGAARIAASSQIAQGAVAVPLPVASPRASAAPAVAAPTIVAMPPVPPVAETGQAAADAAGATMPTGVAAPSKTVVAARDSIPAASRAQAAPEIPVFYTLFQTDRRGAVSPLVASLWGTDAAAATSAPAADNREQAPGAALSQATPADVFGLMHAQQAWSRRS